MSPTLVAVASVLTYVVWNPLGRIEKRQAKERRKEEKKRAKEAAAKAAQEARAAELLKREQAALRLAEIKSEEEFLQALSNDFGEDDRVCFEL